MSDLKSNHYLFYNLQRYQLYLVVLRVSVFVFIGIVALPAQAIDSDYFFRSALNQSVLNQSTFTPLNAMKLNRVESGHIPWIEEIDLRTETTDFDPERQEFTLRFAPSTSKIRNTTKSLIDYYNLSKGEESLDAFEDYCFDLYLDWLNFHFLQREITLLNELDTLWLDKKTLYEKQLGTYKIDFDNLIELEINKNQLSQKKYELNLERQQALEKYALGLNTLDTRILSILEVENKLSKLMKESTMDNNFISDAKTTYKRDEIQKEIAIEQAEKRKYFDFVQFKYRGEEAGLFKETFSLGLGLTFDNSVGRKLKMAKLRMAERELDSEAQLDAIDYNTEIALLNAELNHDLKLAIHYGQIRIDEEDNLNAIAQLINKQSTFDPSPLIDIKEHLISSKIKQLKYEQDVYLHYIKLLKVMGKLRTLPFINYLKA